MFAQRRTLLALLTGLIPTLQEMWRNMRLFPSTVHSKRGLDGASLSDLKPSFPSLSQFLAAVGVIKDNTRPQRWKLKSCNYDRHLCDFAQ